MQAPVSKSELETCTLAILKIAEAAGIQLPGLLREDPLSDVPDVSFDNAVDAFIFAPEVYRSIWALRWKLRNRHENGLIACGAVMEVISSIEQKRPSLRIHHKRWVAHDRGLVG